MVSRPPPPEEGTLIIRFPYTISYYHFKQHPPERGKASKKATITRVKSEVAHSTSVVLYPLTREGLVLYGPLEMEIVVDSPK